MKKMTISILAASMISGTALSSEPGWRVGGGANISSFGSSALDQHGTVTDTDNGVVIEGGYDFNSIAGVKFGLSTSYPELTYTSPDQTTRSQLDGSASSLFVGTDLGYTFELGNKFDIKPYVEVGVAYTMVDLTLKQTSNGNDLPSQGTDTGNWNGYYGLGVRTVYNNNLYFDVTAATMDLQAVSLSISMNQVPLEQPLVGNFNTQ
ncbi:hypothetical protein JCM19239_2299 [Vibrio variabilis]|uniref:Outer membrane protein beta-barrel domain-containing protein n=1 Tax=Vibrio variabilis TaxID=990271 RepID=A0ABQ0JB22_9VIBR|nr:hypothetical protein JCM19239_2299 [Vibrio variabilis]